MLRPRWILLLVLALAIAAAFALLGQWQLERAVDSGDATVDQTTETVVPLVNIEQPSVATKQSSTGQMVSVNGSFVPGDYEIVAGRLNGGDSGYWVTGHLAVLDTETDGASASSDAPPALAVALGWAADETEARDVANALNSEAEGVSETSVRGRFVPSEQPEVPKDGEDAHTITMMSVAALVNVWGGYQNQGVYEGYVVSSDAITGLAVIDSPSPERSVVINWLNIFYAAEWAIFAGFAVFLWYRLAKDGWEREIDEAIEAELAAASGDVK